MTQNDKFISAIRQIAAERKIDPESIIDAIKEALLVSFKNSVNLDESLHERLSIDIEPNEGRISIYTRKDVVAKVADEDREVDLETAKKANPKIKTGETILVDITPKGDFGRIAAQVARQVILQKLSEIEKDVVLNQYKDKVGGVITVYIQRVSREGDVICELSKVKAVMNSQERISNEFYRPGSSVKVLLKAIVDDESGKYMLVSRSDPKFIEALFKMEVPEIETGSVEIVSIAREAGSRTKIAVKSNSEGVDAIGAFIGQKGVRINAVTNELRFGQIEEKIDVVEWSDHDEIFIKNTIRSAKKVTIVDKKSKHSVVIVPEDQLSVSIGKDGQNVRLSSKLTGWNLDIKSDSANE